MRIADGLHPRNNSLNVLRLALAGMVLVSHSFVLSGRYEPRLGDTTLGTIGVLGFFAISGYLIVGSRVKSTSGRRFLWHRFLRIYPGFWVCLIVIAVVFAPIAAAHGPGGVDALSWNSAARYAAWNSTLVIHQAGIQGTLQAIRYPGEWDGSLWTLIYEMGCYLVVFGLGALNVLRRRVVIALALLLAAVDLLVPRSDLYKVHLPVLQALNIALVFVVPLGLAFAAGAVLYFLSDRISVRGSFALAAATICVVGFEVFSEATWLIAFPFAYLLIWLGIRLPFGGLFGRNDISYGVYIYAFPVQQLMSTYGLADHGVALYLAATIPLTTLLALASRLAIETPANRLKSRGLGRHRDQPAEGRSELAKA